MRKIEDKSRIEQCSDAKIKRAKAPRRLIEVPKRVNKNGVVGVLHDEGDSPLEDLRIALVIDDADGPGLLAETTTDAEGRFELNDIDLSAVPANARLVIADKSGQTLARRKLPAAAQLSVGLAIPGIHLPGVLFRPAVTVGQHRLDKATFEDLDPQDVLNIVRRVRKMEISSAALARIRALSPALDAGGGALIAPSMTPILRTVNEIIRLKGWGRSLELEVEALMLPKASFTSKTHDCTNFTITYDDSEVDTSTAALVVVDPGSTNILTTIPAGGTVPTYIRLICFWLERALAAYTNPPFSLKNPAASGKIAVNVTPTYFGGANPSGFTVDVDLDPGILAAVSVHELFHMVQYEYGSLTGSWKYSLMEGGATLSEDSAADALNRYIFQASSNSAFGSGALLNPQNSLESAGYDCALFWRYIAEQHSSDLTEPYVGVETYRKIIEECEAGGSVTNSIRKALRELPWYQDMHEFAYLDAAKLDRTNDETTFGNYVLACYLKDLGVAKPDARFDFLEDEEDTQFDEIVSPEMVAGGNPALPAVTTLAAVTLAGSGTVMIATPLAFTGTISKFASRYYEVRLGAGVTNVDVEFTASAGLTGRLFQIVLIDEDGEVRDIHRSDAATWTKRITNMRDGKALDRILCVGSGTTTSGSFDLDVTSVGATSDVMVTRWHHVVKREYPIDSRYWAWTWVSPDIWVDNNSDGVADSEVYFNYDNKLNIRLHNKGNANATGISVAFWYQDAAPGLSDAGWLPVQNKAGITQSLSGLSLAAGASNNWSVDWSPVPSGTSKHFCIRAVVTSPGDTNTDNKRVLSNFGNVKVKPGGFIDLEILRRNIFEFERPVLRRVIPRFPPGVPGWRLSSRDLKTDAATVLGAGMNELDVVRVFHERELETPRHLEWPMKKIRHSRLALGPHLGQSYSTDPRALPPGVADMPLVTIVHEVDGVALGGVTFALGKPGRGASKQLG